MDKQIITDGVNVSTCEFLTKTGHCRAQMSIMGIDANKCNCFPNCYFKQLKRKEQEYEDLRQYHNKCCEEFENEKQKLIEKYNQFSKDFFIGKYCKKEYCDLLKAKEQECEELKGRLKYIINENKMLKDCATDEHIDIVALKNYISTLEFHNDQLKAEKEELKNVYTRLNSLYNDNCNFTGKLEQTLTEIKEITENINKECLYSDFTDCDDCDMKNRCAYQGKLKILQKISECEVE